MVNDKAGSSKKSWKTILAALCVAALSLAGAAPAYADVPNGWPWSDAPTGVEEAADSRAVRIDFEGQIVMWPAAPAMKDGTTVVPARALLEGIGYSLEWNSGQLELTASRAVGETLVFRVGHGEMNVKGGTAVELPVTPYIEGDLMWVPLRMPAEASGLKVSWNELDQSAVVSDPNAPVRFSVGTRSDNGVLDASDKLTEYFKTEWKSDIRFSIYAPEQYNDRVNIRIAAGDPTDLMLLGNPYRYSDELLQSFAADLTDMLEKYPRLKALASGDAAAARSIGGRLYGIPRPSHPNAAAFPAIRQDWLDRLGLIMPETMDQLLAVLDKFVHNDPDGDGKHNTIGITGRVDGNGLGTLSWVEQAFTGSPVRFAAAGGKVVDNATGKEQRAALDWLARAYKAGLIDKEFALTGSERVVSKLSQGRVGLAAITAEQAAKLTVEAGTSDKFSARWMPIPGLKGTSGAIAPWSTEESGLYIIPRTVPKDKAEAILDWLDRGIAASESDWSGISGLGEADRAVLDNVFGTTSLLPQKALFDQLSDSTRDGYRYAVYAWQDVSYAGKTLPQANALFATGEYGELNRKLQELKVKVISGEASLDDWDRHVKEMTDSKEYRDMMGKLNGFLR
ncbi:extracellular solute-binding protein [Paenibacillus sp. GCM10012303]|uniref:extracellular solute-binding protein n=1 Tax=Paenibacillus sp. GCM10012303 TaxID=3317340 RepID=UPI0036167358